jgi:hypothetical protein
MIKFFTFIYFLFRLAAWPFHKLFIRYMGNDAHKNGAIRKAKRRNKRTGRRYRVMFIAGRYRVYHRLDVSAKKREGKFRDFINVSSLDKVGITVFDTHNTTEPCL